MTGRMGRWRLGRRTQLPGSLRPWRGPSQRRALPTDLMPNKAVRLALLSAAIERKQSLATDSQGGTAVTPPSALQKG